jgi:hypothetical protein
VLGLQAQGWTRSVTIFEKPTTINCSMSCFESLDRCIDVNSGGMITMYAFVYAVDLRDDPWSSLGVADEESD